MIKRMLLAFALVMLTASVNAQNVVREGKTFTSATTTRQSAEKSTGFTWKDSKGKEYPIYMGATGSCYVKKVSSKTGKEYKQYLGTEVSAEICKELGVDYKPRTNESKS